VIDFRYHIVSIVAVFLALALGLFLGSTTLQGTVLDNLKGETKKTTDANKRLRAEVDDLRNQISQGDAFVTSLEPYAVAGRLAGESVVVVSAPGVDNGTRKRVEATLADAGATVSADVRLKDVWTDPAQDSLLDTLATRLADGAELPKGTGAERAAAQLASVLVSSARGRAGSQSLADTLAAYSEAQLLSSGDATPHAGSLVVVLGAESKNAPASPSATGGNADVLALARAFDTAGAATVIAAPAVTTQNGGLLAAARSDSAFAGQVSTVDSVEMPRGQVAVVFALTEELAGRSGCFGSGSGARAPLPSMSPKP
jgi:hypothetical protein